MEFSPCSRRSRSTGFCRRGISVERLLCSVLAGWGRCDQKSWLSRHRIPSLESGSRAVLRHRFGRPSLVLGSRSATLPVVYLIKGGGPSRRRAFLAQIGRVRRSGGKRTSFNMPDLKRLGEQERSIHGCVHLGLLNCAVSTAWSKTGSTPPFIGSLTIYTEAGRPEIR
ncbi:hypothetical protein VTK26DRAFT_1151 [Humicola hyalothermophila]